MIRPFTCVCLVMAAASGLYLYQTKHRAQLLDREIARTYKQIDLTRDRIAALKAEWALLNEPDRLNELAQQHTILKTLAPTQFVALADLPSRLPAPLPPGPSAIPADDAPPLLAAPPLAAPPPTVPIAAAKPAARNFAANERSPADKTAAHPAPRPAAPAVAVASAQPTAAALPPAPAPSPRRPPNPALAAAPLLTPRLLAPVMNVSAGAIQSDAARLPPPGSIGESVARAARLRTGAAPQMLTATSPTYAASTYAAPAYAAPAYAAPAYASPAASNQAAANQTGSALGTAARTALPPPVPFGSGR